MSVVEKSSRYFFWAVMLIITLGVSLRLLMFIENRSLFIDEASLSSQLIDRTYGGLFDNLEYQYAPPFFAVAVKSMSQIFGANEYAPRLIPLLAGLIGILLFYKLCRQYLADKDCIFPMILFCFGMQMLRYATEVKQYSTDVMIALALLLLASNWQSTTFDKKGMISFGILGAVVVWSSMPGVFILFGVGIYFLYEAFQKKNRQKAMYVVGAILIWLSSFALYFFTIIRKDIGLKNLEDYHGRFFIPLFPDTLNDFVKIKNILLSFFQTSIGSTTLAIGFGILTICIACYHFYNKERGKLLLFLLPILAAMLASGLKLYSLIPRLTLFFVPILILLMGLGTAKLMERLPGYYKILVLIPIFVIVFNQQGYQYFYKTYEIEELRPVLYHVSEERKTGDGAFLHYQAENAYVFYSTFYEDAEKIRIPEIYIGDWSESLKDIVLPQNERLWLIFSHVGQEEIEEYVNHFKKEFEQISEKKATGAKAILLKRRE